MIRTAVLFCISTFASALILAEDWPNWRGADRDDVTAENSRFQGVDQAWPRGGPIWETTVGAGASSVLVRGETVYAFGWENGKFILRALDAGTSKEQWRQSHTGPKYGRHAVGDQKFFSGATATPEFDTESGLIFTLSCDGDLRAWDSTKKGQLVWGLNFYDQFGIEQRPQITDRKNTRRDYGYTCAPIVIGNQVIVEVGDPKSGNLHAFDKRSGKPVWTSKNRDVAGHSGGLAPMMVDGVPCLAVATSYHALVVRLDGKNAGKTVAEFPWKTDFSNTISGIAARGNEFLIGSRYNNNAMVKVAVSLKNGAREVWRNKYPTGVCTPVIFKDHLYFANKGIHCVDFKTGQLVWEGGKISDAGSCLITGDERLVVWGNGGDLSLVETVGRSPEKFTQLALKRFVLKDQAWPHVVLANGRLFCKTTDGKVVCFSLKGEQPPETPSVTKGAKPVPQKLNFDAWDAEKPDGQIWSWKQGDGLLKRTGAARRAKLEPRDEAAFSESGSMELKDGAYLIQGVGDALREACQRTNAFSMELVFVTDAEKQNGPARIVSFSKDAYHRNFTLGQEGTNLVLRLRTPQTGANGSNPETPLLKIKKSILNRVVVTYEPGKLTAFLNGELVLETDRVKGDFSNWDGEQSLILGDEFSGGSRDWQGSISALAFYSRVLKPEEVKKRDDLLAN